MREVADGRHLPDLILDKSSSASPRQRSSRRVGSGEPVAIAKPDYRIADCARG